MLTQDQRDRITRIMDQIRPKGGWEFDEQSSLVRAIDPCIRLSADLLRCNLVECDDNDPDVRHVYIPFGDISGSISFNSLNITSLKNSPRSISGDFFIRNTNVNSLEYLPLEIGGTFWFDGTPVASRVLQVFKYSQIHTVYVRDGGFHPEAIGGGPQGVLNAILNHHLQGDRDVLMCQDELIDAGFADIARL